MSIKPAYLVAGAATLAAVALYAAGPKRVGAGAVSWAADMANGVLSGAGELAAPILDPVTQPVADFYVSLKNPVVGAATPEEAAILRNGGYLPDSRGGIYEIGNALGTVTAMITTTVSGWFQ